MGGIGTLWGAATRGEGYRLGRRDGGVIVALVLGIGALRTIYRFFTGRPMLGDRARRTDAEWVTAGTRKLHMNDRTPGWWSFLPEWKRAVVRVAVLLASVFHRVTTRRAETGVERGRGAPDQREFDFSMIVFWLRQVHL
ncbi:MAG: hypothetical protein ACRD0H_13800, partial [Actinomycetes bacterium]